MREIMYAVIGVLAIVGLAAVVGRFIDLLDECRANRAAFGGDPDLIKQFRSENTKIALRRSQESRKEERP